MIAPAQEWMHKMIRRILLLTSFLAAPLFAAACGQSGDTAGKIEETSPAAANINADNDASSAGPDDAWGSATKAQAMFEADPSSFADIAELIIANPSLQNIPSDAQSAPEAGSWGPYGQFDENAADAFQTIQRFVQEQNIVGVWAARYADTPEKTLAYIAFVMFSRTTDGLLEEFYINKYVDPDVTDIEIRANSCTPLEEADWFVCVRR